MVLTELSTGALVGNVYSIQAAAFEVWAGAVEIRPTAEWLGGYGLWNTFPLYMVARNQSSREPVPSRFSLLPSTSRYSNVLVSNRVCPVDDRRTSCEDLTGGLFTPDFEWPANSTVAGTNTSPLDFTNLVHINNSRYDASFTQFYQLQNSAQASTGWMGLSPESEGLIAPDAEITANDSIARTVNDARYNQSSVFSILGSRHISSSEREYYESLGRPTREAFYRLRGSMSWGYTAGVYASKTPGSLVYGGIDLSRFDPTTSHKFQMGRTPRQRFPISVIGLDIKMRNETGQFVSQKIISNTTHKAQIDSEVEFLVLPSEPVHTITTLLGARPQYNGSELYLIDAARHEFLTKQNTTIPLLLGRHDDDNNLLDSMRVDLDYNTLVFPAKQMGMNSTPSNGQQVLAITTNSSSSVSFLGRAFLQSVYMVADYEKSAFNLSVAIPPTRGSDVVTMPDLRFRDEYQSRYRDPIDVEHEIYTDPKVVGATIGATIAVSTILLLIYVFFRRRRRIGRGSRESGADLIAKSDETEYIKSELPGHGLGRKESDSRTIYEASQDDGLKELDAEKGGTGAAVEMAVEMEVHELDAGQPIYVTLASPRP